MATILKTGKVKIDRKQCILCNVCIDIAPKAFYEKGGKSEVKDSLDLKDGELLESVQLAVDSCPVQAISLLRP